MNILLKNNTTLKKGCVTVAEPSLLKTSNAKWTLSLDPK